MKLEIKDITKYGKGKYIFYYRNRLYSFPANQVLSTQDKEGRPWACFNMITGKPRCLFLYFGN